MFKILLAFLLFLAPYSFSFGFSNFFSSHQNYEPLSKPLNIEFPLDHGPHKNFATEWWYVTANLTDENGNALGVQWTLFRSSNNPHQKTEEYLMEENDSSWNSNQIWMGHAAVTTGTSHHFSEKLARGGTGQAGVRINNFSAWIDDWFFSGKEDWTKLKIKAKGGNFEYWLDLETSGPIILHGDNGYSVKTHEGHSSAYYSQPFFRANGEVIIDGNVFLVKGSAWADREWSSSILGPNQAGWDWFSLHLGDDEKLMLFRVRNKGSNEYYSGTLVKKDKTIIHLKHDEIMMTPLSYQFWEDKNSLQKSELPTKWRLEIRNQDFDVTINPINTKAYIDALIPYWEGPITFTGSHEGVGYLEMTGY